ncbi:MAG: hypothetical protein P0Y65_16930 [Candidatus Devosia phytovorans]|uniref:Uncharacterized protein n=1 Tax=Candidatus Devosia phytovorans TaxID=3121372 RepID=A0AAJ5VTG0_9HYPH|nr:hypothetical protein [Devosia sp.]WEK03856.1 MAG: hypothetical protein P0Y65_16930 [Devosia sp.]
MSQSYRVVDLRPESENIGESRVEGVSSPEAASRQALGLDLVRSGARKDLVAQVYWQLAEGSTNMVRLYSRVATPRRR